MCFTFDIYIMCKAHIIYIFIYIYTHVFKTQTRRQTVNNID